LAPRTPKLRTVSTVVTFLEMTADAQIRAMPPLNLPKLALMRAEGPPLHFYRYLYDAIGRDYYWIDRKDITDAALAELIQHPDVQIHVAYVAGVPAGFFEIDRRAGGLVEIMYLGLVPEFQGRGLGKWLLSEAIAAAWAEPTKRLIVETCTLDAPKALTLYQRFGFVPYAREDKVIEVQD
jgi:GNAT superfamily N-acetyltransferase